MSETVERLARMADARATRAESEAKDCRRDIADDSMTDYHRGLCEECLPAYEAEAADWREIASRLRAAPEVAETDEAIEAAGKELDSMMNRAEWLRRENLPHHAIALEGAVSKLRGILRAALRSPRIENER